MYAELQGAEFQPYRVRRERLLWLITAAQRLRGRTGGACQHCVERCARPGTAVGVTMATAQMLTAAIHAEEEGVDMKLGRFNHIGVATPSIADSIAFYRDVMGAIENP